MAIDTLNQNGTNAFTGTKGTGKFSACVQRPSQDTRRGGRRRRGRKVKIDLTWDGWDGVEVILEAWRSIKSQVTFDSMMHDIHVHVNEL